MPDAIQGEIVSDLDLPEHFRNVTPVARAYPIVTPPLYLGYGPEVAPFGMAGFGAAGDCSRLPWLALGAVAMYALPPLLSGFMSGAREAWDERRR